MLDLAVISFDRGPQDLGLDGSVAELPAISKVQWLENLGDPTSG